MRSTTGERRKECAIPGVIDQTRIDQNVYQIELIDAADALRFVDDPKTVRICFKSFRSSDESTERTFVDLTRKLLKANVAGRFFGELTDRNGVGELISSGW